MDDFEKNDSPVISVIMPVYNARQTIERAIDSILEQTYSDFEFIIVNEASTNDGTTEILKKYAARDNRVQIFQKTTEKKGVSVSLNIGLKCARGKYIARMDADDYSYPERFEKQLEYMELNPQIAVSGTQMRVYNSSNYHYSEYYCDPNLVKAELIFDTVVAHPTVFIRKQFIDENNLTYDENCLPEDFDFWTRILEKGGEISNLDQILFDYHNDGNGNVTSSSNVKFHDEVCEIRKRQLKNTLGIDVDTDTEQLLKRVFEYSSQYDYGLILAKAVEFLSEIEQKNGILRKYESRALRKVILKKWNQYLKTYYILSGASDICSEVNLDLSLDENNERSFIESLSEKINVDSISSIDDKIAEYITILNAKAQEIERVIVFGTGMVVKRYTEILEKMDVVAFSRNGATEGELFNGQNVISPNDISKCDYNYILVGSSVFYEEIKRQLIDECHVDEKKILPIELLKFR